MDKHARNAGLRLLNNRRHMSASKQALWLYYFMVVNPNRGAAKHNVTMKEIKELVVEFNRNPWRQDEKSS